MLGKTTRLAPIAAASLVGVLAPAVPAHAVSVKGYKTCASPNTTWGKGGATSGYMLVVAGTKDIDDNYPYYFVRTVDSTKSTYPVYWGAEGPNLQFGQGFCD